MLCSKEMKDSRYLSILHVSCCSCETPTSDDHSFLVRCPFQVFLDYMERSLSLESNHMLVDVIWCSNIAEPTSSGRADLPWSSRPRLGNELGNTNFGCHNFLVRSPFCTFLDSMERSRSLESNHILVDDIWCSHSF